jgi:hypothetical protein
MNKIQGRQQRALERLKKHVEDDKSAPEGKKHSEPALEAHKNEIKLLESSLSGASSD